MEIIYSNIAALSDQEKFALESIVFNESKKIERLINKGKLKVRIKIARKGNRKRFQINYMLETPSKVFTTQSKDTEVSADFDITKAAHKEMAHLLNEVKHFGKKEENNWKKYSLKRLFSKFN